MKRLLIGAVAVGSLLFAATGVASANTATPQSKPSAISLAKPATQYIATAPGGCTSTLTGPASGTCIFQPYFPTGHVTAGPAGFTAWPQAAQPGALSVTFDTPSNGENISGYAVTCLPPIKTSDGLTTITPALPPLVATFVLNPDEAGLWPNRPRASRRH